ncbi:MAG: phage holin family protein [Proteobacteria bacterium]|nr:MAG: phage holin family protein [Pseudomonadota bacterium]
MIVFGVQALVATLIIALSYAVDLWLAAAIVSSVLLIGGVLIALKAKKALNFENLKPKKSADALSDIGSKLKEKAHEFYH